MIRVLAISLLFTACGYRHHNRTEVDNDRRSESCTVSNAGVISCPDGTSYQIPSGERGIPGQDGQNGASGDTGSQGPAGRDGQGIVGPRGPEGIPGTAGAVGPSGKDGTSCTVSETGLVTCGDTTYQIPAGRDGTDGTDGQNGEDGQDGADGAPGAPGTTIYPVFPCPTLAGSYPEVLLCVDQHLYAVFDPSSGTNNIRYVQVGPGSYQTTDGRQCNFQVVSGCTIR